tara:strand:- start:4779 stop:5474 length:696 start_codon:yes stop_codon:yes gene_type:complete
MNYSNKFQLISKNFQLDEDSLEWLKSVPNMNSLQKYGYNNSYQDRYRLSQTSKSFQKFIKNCYETFIGSILNDDLAIHIEIKGQDVYKNGRVNINYVNGFEWNPTSLIQSDSIKNHLFTIIWYKKFEVSGGKLKFKNISKLPFFQRFFFDANPWAVYNNLNSNIFGLNNPYSTEGYQPKEKDLIVLGSKLRFKTERLQWNPKQNNSNSKPQLKDTICIYVSKIPFKFRNTM